MRKIYSIFVAMLVGATSLVAQTNYKITFSANVEMDSIQVKNKVSGETKKLYKPDKVITLQKNAKQDQGTAIETMENSLFLQQTSQNIVVVYMGKAAHLNLMLYSPNGTFVARYSNNVDAGPNAFEIGAASGVYVLVASANNQTASLKILLTQSTPPSILEVLTNKPEPLLKSLDDVITFDEGDEFVFTGYYYSQTSVKTEAITGNKTVSFSFTKVTTPTVSTVQATNITTDGATIGGKITADNGAAVTERGICWATTTNPTVADHKEIKGKGTGSFSVSLTSLSEGTTYYARAYAINSIGTAYGKEVSFTTEKTVIAGAIMGAFSVSANKKVYFSQGNLQYQASTGTWRFAEHQWDFVGTHITQEGYYDIKDAGTVTGSDNYYVDSQYKGWIDLFVWGTSGYEGRKPYMISGYKNYIDISKLIESRLLTGTNYDWGFYNKISNGGNQAGLWRTLTRAEWNYLRFMRPNADVLFGEAYVNGVYGWVILPDNWILPTGLNFQSGTIGPNPKFGIQLQRYTTSDWAKMEANGAVFFPAAGSRRSIDNTNKKVVFANWEYDNGGFWLGEIPIPDFNVVADQIYYVSTGHEGYNSECLNATVAPYGDLGGCALSVRLVRDVE
ncbi:MAG: hypothetical protein J6Y55_00775 [Bacteroidales bacterium]|nr:hypothetical protein [Bacteroidales bacterium]